MPPQPLLEIKTSKRYRTEETLFHPIFYLHNHFLNCHVVGMKILTERNYYFKLFLHKLSYKSVKWGTTWLACPFHSKRKYYVYYIFHLNKN